MLRKLRVWIWCFVHLPRIFNLAQTAAIRSAAGELTIRSSEEAISDIEARIQAIEDTHRKLADAKLELLDLERKDIAAVITRFSELQKTELAAIKRELLFLQRRIAARTDERSAPATASESSATDASYAPSDSVSAAIAQHLAARNEDANGGADDWVRRFAISGVVDAEHPLAHVACGSGWLLKMAEKANVPAYGTIANSFAADLVRQDGVRVEAAGLLSHLATLPDGKLGGLLVTRELEQLTFAKLAGAVDEMSRVMRAGAVLVLQCANPENLQVGSRTRVDPTRTQLIHPDVLSFLVADRGFGDVEVVRQNPVGWEQWLDRKDENSIKLNALLFGPQDYCVIARRS